MHILHKLRSAGGWPVRRKLRSEARKFLDATADCRRVQHDVLARLLALNADSRFSRERGLHVARTVDEFRRCVSVSGFESFRPYVEQMKGGDHQALLGRSNRLLMFSLSSGTTSEAKFVPITEQFLRDYRRSWQNWGMMTFDDHPGVNAKKIVGLASDYDQFRTAGGTPCGNISGLVAAMQRPIVRSMYSVPRVVSKIRDSEARYYTALRTALADPHVGMATTANPSTLIHLAKMADAHKEDLIRDIADGTLSDRFPIDDELRRKLRWMISIPRRRRARELERIVERTGALHPRDFWPGMEVLAVWTGGSAGTYLPSLEHYYGDVPVRDHGLHASEGRMTVPIHDGRASGVLEITSHFFEFIPENEYESRSRTVLEAHELEPGRNYYILLTTSSGLYRYDIQDVVQCTGFYGTTPMLKFLHKGAHISNITGEKVSESQVADAVRKTIDRMSLRLQHFTVAADWGDPPGYQLLVEERDVNSPSVGDSLAGQVDEALQRLNCEYREKRLSGRLAPMSRILLPAGTWEMFVRARQQKLGASVEQYKHPCLVPDMEFTREFLRKYANGARSRNGSPSQMHLNLTTEETHGPHRRRPTTVPE